ncbi:hypothetical protein B0H12DRAFT_1232650 [Mycena haematopus]|nr:hypothetical protein B0H12DRAFT_1232650 [Mycena haematopus]
MQPLALVRKDEGVDSGVVESAPSDIAVPRRRRSSAQATETETHRRTALCLPLHQVVLPSRQPQTACPMYSSPEDKPLNERLAGANASMMVGVRGRRCFDSSSPASTPYTTSDYPLPVPSPPYIASASPREPPPYTASASPSQSSAYAAAAQYSPYPYDAGTEDYFAARSGVRIKQELPDQGDLELLRHARGPHLEQLPILALVVLGPRRTTRHGDAAPAPRVPARIRVVVEREEPIRSRTTGTETGLESQDQLYGWLEGGAVGTVGVGVDSMPAAVEMSNARYHAALQAQAQVQSQSQAQSHSPSPQVGHAHGHAHGSGPHPHPSEYFYMRAGAAVFV